jgi:hypothetical protein
MPTGFVHPFSLLSSDSSSTGVLVNLMISMVKQFLPDDMTEKFQFGCMFAERLDRCLMVPDKVTAQARNYARIIESFQRRFENEASFHL